MSAQQTPNLYAAENVVPFLRSVASESISGKQYGRAADLIEQLRQEVARYESGREVLIGELAAMRRKLNEERDRADDLSHRLNAATSGKPVNVVRRDGALDIYTTAEPDGWILYMRGPDDTVLYQFASRSEPHVGEGWVPLYCRPQEPVAEPLVLHGFEIMSLVQLMAGEPDTEIGIAHFDAARDLDTGAEMPAGHYAWFTDHPEEGRTLLSIEPPRSSDEPEALRTIPGLTTDDDLKRHAFSFDSTGAAGAIHAFRFRERDMLALLRNVIERAQRAAQPPSDALPAFKNFHRLLCERFDYVHDVKDWQRDQLSLIEWIAKRMTQPLAELDPTKLSSEQLWQLADRMGGELVKRGELRKAVQP